MNKKYQNGFFIFGLVVLIIMITQLDFADVWHNIQHAGYWFFAVVILWAFLYLFNTAAWFTIIRSQTKDKTDKKKSLSTGFIRLQSLDLHSIMQLPVG